jgi:hypothetical protein
MQFAKNPCVKIKFKQTFGKWSNQPQSNPEGVMTFLAL